MISRRPRKEGFGANGTIKASFDSTVSVRKKNHSYFNRLIADINDLRFH
jgi:hypothetical protein